MADWFAGRASLRDDVAIDVIDVLDHRDGHGSPRRIGAADVFVVVTPEYNHGYPGPLKAAIEPSCTLSRSARP